MALATDRLGRRPTSRGEAAVYAALLVGLRSPRIPLRGPRAEHKAFVEWVKSTRKLEGSYGNFLSQLKEFVVERERAKRGSRLAKHL